MTKCPPGAEEDTIPEEEWENKRPRENPPDTEEMDPTEKLLQKMTDRFVTQMGAMFNPKFEVLEMRFSPIEEKLAQQDERFAKIDATIEEHIKEAVKRELSHAAQPHQELQTWATT